MKAEELRIGNYVYYNGKIIAVTPYAIKELYYIGDSHANSSVDKRCYKPIPLSEEILLKCGFIEIDQKHNFFILGYEVNLKIHKKIKWVAWCNTVLGNVEINYLHQLQNLYFVLTGKELEIKL